MMGWIASGFALAMTEPMPISPLETIKKRSEFLRVQAAPRVGTASLVLHGCANSASSDIIRVGFTVTKRCGNAVMRNRIKRRLRALAHEILPEKGRAGWEYVLIGKPETALAEFATLQRDLHYALRKLGA
jgi:ribonuclease P protein component